MLYKFIRFQLFVQLLFCLPEAYRILIRQCLIISYCFLFIFTDFPNNLGSLLNSMQSLDKDDSNV